MAKSVFTLGEHRITDLRRRRLGLDASDIEAGGCLFTRKNGSLSTRY
jgi:hypothetical protein